MLYFISCSAGGKVDVETKAPDTITSWEVSAFAVSQSAGLGVVPETQSVNILICFNYVCVQ